MSRLLLLTAFAAAMLGAQTIGGGPSLGFIWDSRGQAVRPILGIPGASILGDPVNASTSISFAAISLRQNLAIVNDGGWKAVDLASSAITALPDGLPVTTRVMVSESGSAAAFYDASNQAMTVVTGIASSSMAANAVSLAALPGTLTRFAVADDGSLLVAASNSPGEALLWIGQDGSTRQLAGLQSTASIRLWNRGASALVVDRAANQIYKIQDPGGNAAITVLASSADGVADPVDAALSVDGGKLWIADHAARTVLGIDLNSRATVSLNCGCDLTAMTPMPDGASFRLNNLNRGPLWLLNAAPDADPRVVFVPPIPQPANSQEAAQ